MRLSATSLFTPYHDVLRIIPTIFLAFLPIINHYERTWNVKTFFHTMKILERDTLFSEILVSILECERKVRKT